MGDTMETWPSLKANTWSVGGPFSCHFHQQRHLLPLGDGVIPVPKSRHLHTKRRVCLPGFDRNLNALLHWTLLLCEERGRGKN